MVFYLFNRDAPLMLFPLPIQIPVKWIVLGIAGLETAYLLLNHFALFYCVSLLGLGAGYVWHAAFFSAGDLPARLGAFLRGSQRVLPLAATPGGEKV